MSRHERGATIGNSTQQAGGERGLKPNQAVGFNGNWPIRRATRAAVPAGVGRMKRQASDHHRLSHYLKLALVGLSAGILLSVAAPADAQRAGQGFLFGAPKG